MPEAPSKAMRKLLESGAKTLELDLSAVTQDTLLRYIGLLDKWNKAYNLSAIRDPYTMVSRHLLDSLSVLPRMSELMAGRVRLQIMDVGTGAGLPGIPLAICLPDQHFTLLDSNGKKTRFVLQTAHELGLKNVQVVQDRIEGFSSAAEPDIILSRAFASLRDFASGCENLASTNTHLFAMKGEYPQQEIDDLPAHWQVVQCEPLLVPGCEGERHLVVMKK